MKPKNTHQTSEGEEEYHSIHERINHSRDDRLFARLDCLVATLVSTEQGAKSPGRAYGWKHVQSMIDPWIQDSRTKRENRLTD